MSINNLKVCAVVVAFSLFVAPPVQAGPLDGHPNAYAGWTGSVPYSNGTLTGNLDYAVFTAADFNANFAGLGYVPGDQLVYTYQIENTGASFVSTEVVGISNPANTIGSFNIGIVAPSGANFVGGNAEWTFNPTIPTGDTSYGLAFSSPQIPIAGGSLTVNGGASALVSGIPTPGPNMIPEPASFLLLFAGGAGMMLSRSKKFGS